MMLYFVAVWYGERADNHYKDEEKQHMMEDLFIEPEPLDVMLERQRNIKEFEEELAQTREGDILNAFNMDNRFAVQEVKPSKRKVTMVVTSFHETAKKAPQLMAKLFSEKIFIPLQ